MRRHRLGSGKPGARSGFEAMTKLKVPRFAEVIAADPTARKEIPKSTYHKWVSGDMPASVRWLMRHPKAMRALAEDAEAILAEENSAAIRER